jgi:dTDP-4-amino-4,6-dideoxygalactose transaminase
VEKRRRNFDFYRDHLADLPGILFPAEPEGCKSNRWLTTIVFDPAVYPAGTNEKLRVELEKLNIETRPLWKPLHQQPVFAGAEYYGNGVSDELFANGLCLPSGSNLTIEKLTYVTETIKQKLNEIC